MSAQSVAAIVGGGTTHLLVGFFLVAHWRRGTLGNADVGRFLLGAGLISIVLAVVR